MKLMIASDIHGSAFYCRAMIEAFEREEADRLLLLGDILYHGPRNDLPAERDRIHYMWRFLQVLHRYTGSISLQGSGEIRRFVLLYWMRPFQRWMRRK